MSDWNFDHIPDQGGRRAIVTGANTGIGYETALALAKKGAHVTLACRNPEKGADALSRMLDAAPDATIELELIDLSDLESVKAFADRVAESFDSLDLLILNAGVMVPPESKTKQGFELQFGVNHLGHFALTGHLLPLLQNAEGSRVVVLSSTAAHGGTMNFDDLHFERRGYKAWLAYGQSKLANQLFTRELQKRLAAAGSRTLVTAAHPGWTATDLQRTAGILGTLNPLFAMQPWQGALPTLRAATDPEAGAGDYYGPDGFMQVRGYPKRISFVKKAKNDATAARLWEISEELTGVRFELPARA